MRRIYSVAMGSATRYEGGRKRVRHEIFPVPWGNRSAGQQGSQDEIHVQCSDKIQGRVEEAGSC